MVLLNPVSPEIFEFLHKPARLDEASGGCALPGPKVEVQPRALTNWGFGGRRNVECSEELAVGGTVSRRPPIS